MITLLGLSLRFKGYSYFNIPTFNFKLLAETLVTTDILESWILGFSVFL